MLKTSIGLGLALLLVPAHLLATHEPGGDERKAPAQRVAKIYDPLLSSGPEPISTTLAQTLGAPGAGDMIRTLPEGALDTGKVAVGFFYFNDTGRSVFMEPVGPPSAAAAASQYFFSSSRDTLVETTVAQGPGALRQVIKPFERIEVHASLPGHEQAFRFVEPGGYSFTVPVIFKERGPGVVPELTFHFATHGTPPPEILEPKDGNTKERR
jgi:hypothetical protein